MLLVSFFPGIYGIKGTPSTSTYPGGRDYLASWINLNGDLWLFGGSTPSGKISFKKWKLNE